MRATILIVLFALCACDSPGGPGASHRAVAIPENAIQVGDQLFMVPLSERVQECQAYRPFSPTHRVQQAIHYRTADGRFVRDRGQAVCD